MQWILERTEYLSCLLSFFIVLFAEHLSFSNYEACLHLMACTLCRAVQELTLALRLRRVYVELWIQERWRELLSFFSVLCQQWCERVDIYTVPMLPHRGNGS